MRLDTSGSMSGMSGSMVVSDTEGRGFRPRASLDSNNGASTTRVTNRERRGTVTSIFRP